MKLTRYEMETIINYNMEEEKATVYTRDYSMIKKLDSLASEYPNVYRLIDSTDIDRTYEVPKQLVNIRRPKKMTNEKRDLAREQIRRVNMGKAASGSKL